MVAFNKSRQNIIRWEGGRSKTRIGTGVGHTCILVLAHSKMNTRFFQPLPRGQCTRREGSRGHGLSVVGSTLWRIFPTRNFAAAAHQSVSHVVYYNPSSFIPVNSLISLFYGIMFHKTPQVTPGSNTRRLKKVVHGAGCNRSPPGNSCCSKWYKLHVTTINEHLNFFLRTLPLLSCSNFK